MQRQKALGMTSFVCHHVSSAPWDCVRELAFFLNSLKASLVYISGIHTTSKLLLGVIAGSQEAIHC